MADSFSLGSYQHWDCICNCAHLLGHVWDCKVSVYNILLWYQEWSGYVCDCMRGEAQVEYCYFDKKLHFISCINGVLDSYQICHKNN